MGHGASHFAEQGICSLCVLVRAAHRRYAEDEVVKAEDSLADGLTEKQKEIFEDYMTAQREVNVLTDCETFCMAFKLGAKIMLDVLTEGQMRAI